MLTESLPATHTNLAISLYTTYDLDRILGQALPYVQSANQNMLVETVPHTATHNYGTTDLNILDENGDMLNSNYGVWHTINGS